MYKIIELFNESHGIKINEYDLITLIETEGKKTQYDKDGLDEEICANFLNAFERWYYTSDDKNGKTILNLICNSSLTRTCLTVISDALIDHRIGLLRKIFTEASVKCGVAHSHIISNQQEYNSFVDRNGIDLKQFLDNVYKNGMLEKDSFVDWCIEHQDYDEGDMETAQGRWYAEQCMAYESALDTDFGVMLDCTGHMVTEVLSMICASIIQNCYVLSENMFYRNILTDVAMRCLNRIKPEMTSRSTMEGCKMLDAYITREFVAHFMAFQFVDYETLVLRNYDNRVRLKMNDIF